MSGSALVSLVFAALLDGLAVASVANFGDIMRHIIFRSSGQHYDFVDVGA